MHMRRGRAVQDHGRYLTGAPQRGHAPRPRRIRQFSREPLISPVRVACPLSNNAPAQSPQRQTSMAGSPAIPPTRSRPKLTRSGNPSHGACPTLLALNRTSSTINAGMAMKQAVAKSIPAAPMRASGIRHASRRAFSATFATFAGLARQSASARAAQARAAAAATPPTTAVMRIAGCAFISRPYVPAQHWGGRAPRRRRPAPARRIRRCRRRPPRGKPGC